MIDTLKPSQDVIDHPETKHDNTPGLAALVSHHLDETFKASVCAWETLADPVTAKSGDPAASPLARAFNNKGTLWDLFARDEFRGRRFNVAMQGAQALQPADTILKAFNWKDLPNRSVVVDVGGGVGSLSLILAREFPSLELVVQDLPNVMEDAKKVWKKSMPNAKVTLEAQDFFEPQPKERSVSVFLLKHILHDWSDEYCVKILSQLRAVARPDTTLLLVESLVPFACHDPSNDDKNGIPGSVPHEAPPPLLANFGAVHEMSYVSDIGMFLLFNGQDRTVRHMDQLLLSAGWKLKLVRPQEMGAFFQAIEAIPVEAHKSLEQ